jgi:hypothetical protein
MTDVFQMNSNSLPKASPEESKRLSAFIAEARSAKGEAKFAQLDKYRDVLIKERAQASVREITEAVVKLGIEVSEETVRLWFKRHAVAPKTTMLPKPIKRVSASASPNDDVPTPPPTRGPRVARNDI